MVNNGCVQDPTDSSLWKLPTLYFYSPAPGFEIGTLSLHRIRNFGETLGCIFELRCITPSIRKLYAPNPVVGIGSAFAKISHAFPARDTQFGFKFLW